jgi:MFS family permease
VCSLPAHKRQWFVVEDNYVSLADDLNMDFRCEHYETAGMLYFAISLTIVCEKLFFSSFSDYFGRKNALLFTTSLMLFGICLIMVGAWLHSMHISIGGLLIASLSSANSFQSAICIAT